MQAGPVPPCLGPAAQHAGGVHAQLGASPAVARGSVRRRRADDHCCTRRSAGRGGTSPCPRVRPDDLGVMAPRPVHRQRRDRRCARAGEQRGATRRAARSAVALPATRRDECPRQRVRRQPRAGTTPAVSVRGFRAGARAPVGRPAVDRVGADTDHDGEVGLGYGASRATDPPPQLGTTSRQQARKGTFAMSGFKKFLLRGNLVDLAVAVIIRAAFGALLVALTEDFITPLLGAIGGTPNFSTLTFTVNKPKFRYGDFLNALIAFMILAAVIYFLVVLPFSRL